MSNKERRAKLTDNLVNAAKVEGQRYIVWDTLKKGFGLRVEPSGHKSYIVRYRANGGGRNAPRRQMKVKGEPGQVLTAEIARRLANLILADVAHGKDPQNDLKSKRKEMSVANLCELYLDEGIETKKSSTIATDRGRIARHILPLLGRHLISEVSSSDIDKFMRDVAKGKTRADVKTKLRGRAIVEGGKGAATRTVGLLGGVFSFAVRRKLLRDNPVRGVKRYADKKGERFLSDVELANLGATLRDMESKGSNKSAIDIIRLLIFTGARKSEITTLKWSEVDFERQCLRLADSKTGAKLIELGPPALQLIAGLDRGNNAEFVFPAEVAGRSFQGTEKVWKIARANAGLEGVRIHDLRHSFASKALATGSSLPLIGRLLGHADIKTTSRYTHLADDPVRAAAARASNGIAAAMEEQRSSQISDKQTTTRRA